MDVKGIKLIILFGSRARGTEGRQSDADVAVLADHPLTIEEKTAVGEKISRELSLVEDAVDVVDLWSAPPLLQNQVAGNGKLLFGDKTEFLRFRVLAWKQYQNTAKFRRAREKSLQKLNA